MRNALKPDGAYAQLGTALEVRYVGHDGAEREMTFAPATMCLWSAQGRAVVIPTGARRTRQSASEISTTLAHELTRAAEVFRTWTAYQRDAAQVHRVDLVRVTDRPVPLGRCLAVAYRSDKFGAKGNTTDYEHATGPRVVLYQAGSVMLVAGGKLRLTARGLEG